MMAVSIMAIGMETTPIDHQMILVDFISKKTERKPIFVLSLRNVALSIVKLSLLTMGIQTFM